MLSIDRVEVSWFVQNNLLHLICLLNDQQYFLIALPKVEYVLTIQTKGLKIAHFKFAS